jgi:hypothetical protein
MVDMQAAPAPAARRAGTLRLPSLSASSFFSFS